MFDFKEIYRLLHHGFELQPAATLLDVSDDVEVLHITKKTKALERLPTFKNLRFLNAHDIGESQFQHICTATQITYLAANIYGIKEIRLLGNLVNLRALELTDNTKLTSLNGLEALTGLQLLALSNCPIQVDLAPLSACKDLRYLWLSSRYAKAMRVSSLDPLSELTHLEIIKFANVRVEDCRLSGLHNLTNLVEVQLPDFFPHEEFVALAAALPNAHGRWLDKHAGAATADGSVGL